MLSRAHLVRCSLLVAALGSAWTSQAHATIVWEGKEVRAWPDVPIAAAPEGAALAVSKPVFPHPSGSVIGLTILVDFSDQAAAYTKEDVDAWLNQKGFTGFGLKGSVRDYYLGQSRGKVDYQNEVHGFYRAKNPKSYYQGGTAYERADELWAEVVAALDSEIDYSNFDNDGDGKTEAISLLYAGGEGTFGKGLWPHASGSNEQRDGVRLNRYMMTAMNSKPTNYVFSHESGHMLFGWPDLYGVGDYCIMANRGSDTNPVGINDMFRADQGWIDVMDIDASTNARLSSTPDGVVYRFVNSARPTEHFLWSNLQNKDEWVSIAGGGLLVWHFDNAIRGNNPPDPLQLAVVQAGGNRKLAATTWPEPGSAATDLFAKGGKSELSDATQPNAHWNDGSSSGLRIYDISAPGATMQFSVGTGPLPAGGTGGTATGGTSAGGTGTGGTGTGGTGTGGMGGASTGGNGATAGEGGVSGGPAGSANGGLGGGGSGGAIASGGNAVGGSASGLGASGGALPAQGGAGGSAGAASAASPDSSATDSGCSCRLAAPPAAAHGLHLGVLGALALLLRRRTSRKRLASVGGSRA